MDKQQNEQTQETVVRTPRQRKSSRKKYIAIPIPGFITHIGEDVRWYYDVRLWLPLFLLLLILALLPGKKQAPTPVETVPPTQATELPPEETEAPPEEILPEAEALAILADSVGAGRSNNVKTIIMWVAINRSEDRANGYGLSLIEEIARPNQWQGYNENGEYSQETYEIAKSVLETQANGGLRPLDEGMLWFILNDNGSITVRNEFLAMGNKKWYEKTVK